MQRKPSLTLACPHPCCQLLTQQLGWGSTYLDSSYGVLQMQYSLVSFLASFEVVEIIFFFLDLESFSSSRFLFWEATGSGAAGWPAGGRLCAKGGEGGGGGAAGAAGGGAGTGAGAEGVDTAAAPTGTTWAISFSFFIFRSLFSSSCGQLTQTDDHQGYMQEQPGQELHIIPTCQIALPTAPFSRSFFLFLGLC